MKHQIIVNNYILGSIVPKTPTDKIIKKVRLDYNHTLIIYEGLTLSELGWVQKYYNNRLKEVI